MSPFVVMLNQHPVQMLRQPFFGTGWLVTHVTGHATQCACIKNLMSHMQGQ